MATLGKEYQAQVKDASSVLVGVAQVRVGKPSVRDAGTGVIKALQFVGTSTLLTDTSTGTSVDVVRPADQSTGGTLPAGCTVTSGGTYSTTDGKYDGCFIIRAVDATHVDIFGPNGYKDAGILTSAFASAPKDMKLASSTASGVTIQGVLATTITEGMTWVVPVWSGAAQDKVQTGIVTPYSMFSAAAESVGGLKSASFSPRIDSIKTLESGFPSEVADRIIEKTSVDIKFESLEYNNANIGYLKNMVAQVINEAKMPSVPMECVLRTRGNTLISFWVPNAGITQFPSYAPTNDFSSLPWEAQAGKMTEITGETDTYNVWLKLAPIFTELTYKH